MISQTKVKVRPPQRLRWYSDPVGRLRMLGAASCDSAPKRGCTGGTWAVKADGGGGEGVQLPVAEQRHIVWQRHQLA